MISCAEAVRQLWEYLEGGVSDADRARVDEHLVFCRRCCGEVEFTEELRRLLAEHAEDPLPEEVRARMHSLLEGLGEP